MNAIASSTGEDVETNSPAHLEVNMDVPMITLNRYKYARDDRHAGCSATISEDEQELLAQVTKRIKSIQDDNSHVNQKIRQGVMCYFENKEGTDFYTAVNYNLFSHRRVVHHAMVRCLVIRLKFVDEKEMVLRRYARRLHELSARIHKRGRSCFAGSSIDAVQLTAAVYIYYHPRYARSVYQWAAAWSRTVSPTFDIKSEKDPSWRHYYEDLAPDETNYFRISNQRFYMVLEKKKYDFSKETSLWMLLAFHGADAAKAALDILREDGFILKIGPEEEEGLHYVIVEKTTRLGLERLNLMTDRIISFIRPLEGQLVSFDREDHFQKSYLRIAGTSYESLSK
jgi:hypothetical protein